MHDLIKKRCTKIKDNYTKTTALWIFHAAAVVDHPLEKVGAVMMTLWFNTATHGELNMHSGRIMIDRSGLVVAFSNHVVLKRFCRLVIVVKAGF